jgi:hypothetical protein
MDIEDERLVIELSNVNVQALMPLLTSSTLLLCLAIAAVGTSFCLIKLAHRHWRTPR